MEFFNLLAVTGILVELPWISYNKINEASVNIKIQLDNGYTDKINLEVYVREPQLVQEMRENIQKYKKGVLVGIKGELRVLKKSYTTPEGKWFNRIIISDPLKHSCRIIEENKLEVSA